MRLRLLILVCVSSAFVCQADAQVSVGRSLSASSIRTATLKEQLLNRLRATAADQRGYIDFVVSQVDAGRLDARLVIAVERYALRRNSHLPFLFFERAMRFEAGRRGVVLPPVRQFASTRPSDSRIP